MTAAHLSFATALAVIGTAALADTWDNTGTARGKTSTEVFALAEDHMLMDTRTVFETHEMTDPESPVNGMSGPCFGAMESVAGALTGGGKCMFTDPDGDIVVLDWTAERWTEEGGFAGPWEVASGTGKWDGASGAGEYVTTFDAETGEATNEITGEITLP